MSKIILVTGANGQVGQELQAIASNYPTFNFLFVAKNQLDISDREAVEIFFHEHPIDYCINCAAYTAVDKAESDKETAQLINTAAVAFLAENCNLQGIPLIHLSTDYVYHQSENNLPFKETDATNPMGVYAITKLDGDLLALQIHPLTMVIRTSWVYSSFGNNFVKTMIRLGKERGALSVVFDQIGTPTYARDLAMAMLEILQKIVLGTVNIGQMQGIFHYSNEGVTSWYDFAKAIFELENIACTVTPIESAQFPTPAQRPPFSVLNKGKIKQAFLLEIPHWRESLVKMLHEI